MKTSEYMEALRIFRGRFAERRLGANVLDGAAGDEYTLKRSIVFNAIDEELSSALRYASNEIE